MPYICKLAPAGETEADVTAFLKKAYQVILGRNADESGLASYLKNMANGATADAVIDDMMQSQEYRDRRIEVDVRLLPDDAISNLGSRFPAEYAPPGEAGRSYAHRRETGFLDRYCRGDLVLDVGYSGYDNPGNKTALPGAIGIDLDYPGYDGIRLPFDDGVVDTVFSSHCLEHIPDETVAIQDWFRVLKTGGFIVCMVPSQALYEKRVALPSIFNPDHKRFYTPASFVRAFETALEVNTYKIRHMAENDRRFRYDFGPERHSDGCYEIELVIEKITPPDWDLAD